uniref:START domain-containing protein n=1 Tax=Caenorhabditis tropicalis TaxID=1561998 RepID=A0A1I7U6I8_9PELO
MQAGGSNCVTLYARGSFKRKESNALLYMDEFIGRVKEASNPEIGELTKMCLNSDSSKRWTAKDIHSTESVHGSSTMDPIIFQK